MNGNFYNKKIFIEKSNKKHLFKYDYSLLEFSRLRDKVIIICPKHGQFEQRAQSHLIGSGCKNCYLESRNPTFDEFIEIANNIHKNKYTYIEYKSMKSKSIIMCSKHGFFSQLAYKHLLGNGCPKCSNESSRLSINDFIERSNNIHKNIYDYKKVEYVNHSTKVCIVCPKHGDFHQTPNNHLIYKKGCPKCSRIISKMEESWLDSINNGSIIRQFTIKIDNKLYKVDGYDPNTNTIYEFYGDFWHGNINIYNENDINKVSKIKFGDLYKETINRESHLKTQNYNIVSIWENEFKENDKNFRNRRNIQRNIQ